MSVPSTSSAMEATSQFPASLMGSKLEDAPLMPSHLRIGGPGSTDFPDLRLLVALGEG